MTAIENKELYEFGNGRERNRVNGGFRQLNPIK